MIKCFAVVLLLLAGLLAQAQQPVPPTDQLVITGQVAEELVVRLADLVKFSQRPLADVVITNHLGEPKGTAKDPVGVLLREVLGQIKFDTPSPRQLSEFFLVCIASDGYKAVFSWNEIFNSPLGDSIYLVVAKDGKVLAEMDERILLVCPADLHTGRRYIKGLRQIVVRRAE
jgi:hypothetical protein